MKRWQVLIAGLILILLIGGGGFYVYKRTTYQNGIVAIPASSGSANDAGDTTSTAPVSTSTPVTPEVTQGTLGYQNTNFHFGFLFPNDLKATEYQEQAGRLTVTFQDPTTDEGFEVYVTPFSGTQIDETRFKLDEPSGTFEDPTQVVVNGVTATKFYGYNGLMGSTTEVWFIHGGFLYEVTTYQQLDSWLGQIMQTWKFI